MGHRASLDALDDINTFVLEGFEPKYPVFYGDGPCSRSYGRTAALRRIVQPVMKMNRKMINYFIFTSNGAPVE